MTAIIGVDLGQSADYTAKAFIDLSRVDSGTPHPERGQWQDVRYVIRRLERPALKTPYPDIVRELAEQMRNPLLRDAALVVDATGVGRPVIDMMREHGLSPIPVTIAGGKTVTQDATTGFWSVPKPHIVGAMAVALQTDRLHVVQTLEHAKTWRREAEQFKVKITKKANDTYEAWREGDHDDLVLATAIAVWWGEKTNSPGYRETWKSAEERGKELRRQRFVADRDRPFWHGPKKRTG